MLIVLGTCFRRGKCNGIEPVQMKDQTCGNWPVGAGAVAAGLP